MGRPEKSSKLSTSRHLMLKNVYNHFDYNISIFVEGLFVRVTNKGINCPSIPSMKTWNKMVPLYSILRRGDRVRWCRQGRESDYEGRGESQMMKAGERVRWWRQGRELDDAGRGESLMMKAGERVWWWRQGRESDDEDRKESLMMKAGENSNSL